MAYPNVSYMRRLLPREGEGITDTMIQAAIDAAIAEVYVTTLDALGVEPLGSKAAEKYAHADLLEKLYPRDARSFLGREEDSDPATLRGTGDRALLAFTRLRDRLDPGGSLDSPKVAVHSHYWGPDPVLRRF